MVEGKDRGREAMETGTEADLVGRWEGYFAEVTKSTKELARQLELLQIGAVEMNALRAVLVNKLTPREVELLRRLSGILPDWRP